MLDGIHIESTLQAAACLVQSLDPEEPKIFRKCGEPRTLVFVDGDILSHLKNTSPQTDVALEK